jgi:hypothetical protein
MLLDVSRKNAAIGSRIMTNIPSISLMIMDFLTKELLGQRRTYVHGDDSKTHMGSVLTMRTRSKLQICFANVVHAAEAFGSMPASQRKDQISKILTSPRKIERTEFSRAFPAPCHLDITSSLDSIFLQYQTNVKNILSWLFKMPIE